MFTYMLYITPLSETASELCKKIEGYTKEPLATKVYSDTNSGICIEVLSSKEVDIEEVIWESLGEGVIPHGNYWSIHIGYTSLINKKYLKDKYVNNISYAQFEEEETEIVDKTPQKYKIPTKEKESSIISECTWRFL